MPHGRDKPRHLRGRASTILSALNHCGIRGDSEKTLLRKHAQSQFARQIEYYGHEVVFRARLPSWAASAGWHTESGGTSRLQPITCAPASRWLNG